MSASPGPLFFHHIPKTGGTSLINMLRAFTPLGQAFTEANNRLSKPFTEQLAAAALPSSALVHGHPGWGACRPFRGSARFLTLLREPRRQIVSHYLHAVRDPSMPQHTAAKALGFQNFLRTYRYIIPFQTNALYLSITDPDEERRRALQDPAYGGAFHLERYFAAQLQPVFAFLDEMLLAGTLETIDEFVASLAELEEWSHTPSLPHDNAAVPAQRAEASGLMEQLEELVWEPDLAPLFAIERATYCKARSLATVARSRRLWESMCFGGRRAGIASFVVHCSSEGEIVLGENFEPAKPAANWWDSVPEPPAGWWTRGRQVSRLYVKLNQAGPRRLIMRADCLHGVTPQEVLLCSGGRWLDLATVTTSEGATLFSAVIGASADSESEYCELLLYLEWNRYPDGTPFYPAIRFTEFELMAEAPARPHSADCAVHATRPVPQ